LIGQWDRTHASGINAPSRLAQRVGFGGEIQLYQSFNTCYKDTGLWGMYFVCNPMACDGFIKNFQKEW
jgi:processing peptidase subunit beta